MDDCIAGLSFADTAEASTFLQVVKSSTPSPARNGSHHPHPIATGAKKPAPPPGKPPSSGKPAPPGRPGLKGDSSASPTTTTGVPSPQREVPPPAAKKAPPPTPPNRPPLPARVETPVEQAPEEPVAVYPVCCIVNTKLSLITIGKNLM